MIESPEKVLARVYDADLGFLPTNKSIKPVHIANGLARWLEERTYRTTALAQTLRRYVKNQRQNLVEERHPNAAILERYGSAFESRTGGAVDVNALSALRSLSQSVLGADDAVYDEVDKSSYTLSHRLFASRDPSDARAGLFLARLVTAGEPGPARQQLTRFLNDDSDPWTVLALPLLQLAEERQEQLQGDTAGIVALSGHLFTTGGDGKLTSSTLRELRAGLDRLAEYEKDEGSKLNSLRRMVLFGCFAIHVHLLARWSEVVENAPRPPILLDMFDGERIAVRDASRATVRAAGDAVEGLLYARVREHIAALVAERGSVATVLAEVQQVSPKAYERYEVLPGGDDASVERLADAYVDVGLENIKAHPIEYLTELGRRAGYMTPWAVQGRGGKLQKRYGVNAEFLEVLVTTVVAPGDEMEFNEFLDALRERFGIVVGRPRDDAAIRANNIREVQFGTPVSIQEEELRANVNALRRAIESIGFAKTYADGRTLISTTLTPGR